MSKSQNLTPRNKNSAKSNIFAFKYISQFLFVVYNIFNWKFAYLYVKTIYSRNIYNR